MKKEFTGIVDDEGEKIYVGDTIHFSYGIPPIGVNAEIAKKGNSFIALTPDHNPKTVSLKTLQKYNNIYKC